MELFTAITLFGSIFWGIFAIVLFLLACFWADFEENGFIAFFFLIVFGVLFYFFGKDTWLLFTSILTWQFFIAYFGAGFLHALIRIFFYGRDQQTKANEYLSKHPEWEYEIDRSELKGHVFRWWFLWPVSLISWFIKDIVKDVCNFVYDKLTRVFNYVMDLGMKSVPPVKKEVKKEK